MDDVGEVGAEGDVMGHDAVVGVESVVPATAGEERTDATCTSINPALTDLHMMNVSYLCHSYHMPGTELHTGPYLPSLR